MASTQLYVGTAGFGADAPHAILKLSLSHADGALTRAAEHTTTDGENPGYVLPSPETGMLYVGLEDEVGSIQAYKVDPSDPSRLSAHGEAASSSGRHPCYVAIDNSGKWLLAANYSSGSVACLPVNLDGSVGAASDSKAHQGGELIDLSLHDRQEMPHCHCILPNPAHDRWIAVCDLGLSAVFVYELDAARGSLIGAADNPRHLRLDPGVFTACC